MVFLKMVTILVAGVLSLLAVRHLMREMEAAKARVKAARPRDPRVVTKLRQDPRTGIYYPQD